MLSTAGIAKKWRKPTLALAAVSGLCVVAVSEHGLAVASGVMDPLSLLSARSPGARAGGALTQTKHAKAPKGPGVTEHVLSKVRSRPSGPPVIELPVGSLASDIPTALPSPTTQPTGFPVGNTFPIAGLTGGGSIPGVTSGVLPVGGIGASPSGGGASSGNGSGTTGSTTGTPPTGPVAPVPEPGTWIAMILGFFVTGALMRRGAKRDHHVPIAADR